MFPGNQSARRKACKNRRADCPRPRLLGIPQGTADIPIIIVSPHRKHLYGIRLSSWSNVWSGPAAPRPNGPTLQYRQPGRTTEVTLQLLPGISPSTFRLSPRALTATCILPTRLFSGLSLSKTSLADFAKECYRGDMQNRCINYFIPFTEL
ncbi:hypothetical protein J6590_047576 [Homalodisca vitripennis]|nr:hypothetical protein J6590_047576 [Homalodisca vitripennis]